MDPVGAVRRLRPAIARRATACSRTAERRLPARARRLPVPDRRDDEVVLHPHRQARANLCTIGRQSVQTTLSPAADYVVNWPTSTFHRVRPEAERPLAAKVYPRSVSEPDPQRPPLRLDAATPGPMAVGDFQLTATRPRRALTRCPRSPKFRASPVHHGRGAARAAAADTSGKARRRGATGERPWTALMVDWTRAVVLSLLWRLPAIPLPLPLR